MRLIDACRWTARRTLWSVTVCGNTPRLSSSRLNSHADTQ